MNKRKREEKKEVNFHPIWAVEYVAEEMPVVDLPLVHLQTWTKNNDHHQNSFLIKQVLVEFSSIMTSSPAWCETFSTGSYKWSSFSLDGFSSMYRDLHAKGTGSFCGQMKLILCTKHSPQGRIIAQVIREIL